MLWQIDLASHPVSYRPRLSRTALGFMKGRGLAQPQPIAAPLFAERLDAFEYRQAGLGLGDLIAIRNRVQGALFLLFAEEVKSRGLAGGCHS